MFLQFKSTYSIQLYFPEISFADCGFSLIFHLLWFQPERWHGGNFSTFWRSPRSSSCLWTGCPGDWNPAPLPVQLWQYATLCFLVRGRRVHLQDWPSPLLLALCTSEDIRRQERNLLYRFSTEGSVQLFSQLPDGPSQPWMWVTPEGTSFLKVKVLLSCFRKWFRSPRILQLIWFGDGKVSCGTLIGRVLLTCTWYLRKCLWCEETRDQLDSETDQAAWPVNSPIYIGFQESPAGEARIFMKCIPALKVLYLSQQSHCPVPFVPPPPTSVLIPGKEIPVYWVPPGIS